MNTLSPSNSLRVSMMAWASPVVCLLFALQELWQRHPAYHFVPLPLAVLIWSLLKNGCQFPLVSRYPRAVKALAVAHLVLALTSFILVSPCIAGFAFAVAMLAYSVAWAGAAPSSIPHWALPSLSLFLIPPPMMLDNKLHQVLAGLAAQLSQTWLDAMQVLHVVEGTIVVTPERRFFVDDACSGTNTMLVASCIALVICIFRRRSWPHALAMVITAAMVSVASNVLRICVVIGGWGLWGLKLDHGAAHEILGMAFFVLDLFLVWSADHGWHFILNFASNQSGPMKKRDTLPSSLPVMGGWTLRLNAAIALTGIVILVGPIILSPIRFTGAGKPTLSELSFEMPKLLEGWTREGDKPLENSIIGNLGVRNQVWLYRKGELEAYVAVNYPFEGFHDTRLCYNGQGWQFQKQVDGAIAGDGENTVRYLQMYQPSDLSEASLWLSVLNDQGIPQKFASENPIDQIPDRIFSRWTDPGPVSTTFVLQVLTVEPAAASEVKGAFTELFSGARAWLSNSLISPVLQKQKQS